MGIVERLLQNEFRELNVKYDAKLNFTIKNYYFIEPYIFKLELK